MPPPIPPGITAEHVRAAARRLDAGLPTPFGPPTKWLAVIDNREYAPKAVIGAAAEIGLGLRLQPTSFSSGEGRHQAVGYLRRLGFEGRRLDGGAIPSFTPGSTYSRADMQRACGLTPSQGGNWATGYHRQSGDWFVMCAVGAAGRTGHDYGNRWEGTYLRWFGKTDSHIEQATIQDMIAEDARVHLFTRTNDRDDFTYHGLVKAVEVVPVVPVEILWAPVDAEFGHAGPTVVLPDEQPSTPVVEGASRTVTVSTYERDASARRRCIARWGCRCMACGLLMSEMYGPLADGYVHVHHLAALGDIGQQHEVNPEEDLRPLCPNCHAVVHLARPMLTLEQLRDRIGNQRAIAPRQ